MTRDHFFPYTSHGSCATESFTDLKVHRFRNSLCVEYLYFEVLSIGNRISVNWFMFEIVFLEIWLWRNALGLKYFGLKITSWNNLCWNNFWWKLLVLEISCKRVLLELWYHVFFASRIFLYPTVLNPYICIQTTSLFSDIINKSEFLGTFLIHVWVSALFFC